MVEWFHEQSVEVMVEPDVFKELQPCNVMTWEKEVETSIRSHFQDRYNISKLVDFVVTLGGDGTLLFASSLFPKTMPPVISFHMGTLGFLTPFFADDFITPLSQVAAFCGVETR